MINIPLPIEPVIGFEKVSVEFQVRHERPSDFKELVLKRLTGRARKTEPFRALDQLDLEVMRGECFGLIGPNGAGKSTALKLVSKILRPIGGRVWVKGRVAPLLELGAGFHPELTGRENLILNGTILGFTRQEMLEKMDRIVEFASLEEFIDAPLRTYSSGMSARLGFAVATDAQPDILVVDEVLSVGDEAFLRRSEERMRRFLEGQTTIIIVSHAMETIRSLCDRVAWIDKGRARAVGPPDEVIDAYLEATSSES